MCSRKRSSARRPRNSQGMVREKLIAELGTYLPIPRRQKRFHALFHLPSSAVEGRPGDVARRKIVYRLKKFQVVAALCGPAGARTLSQRCPYLLRLSVAPWPALLKPFNHESQKSRSVNPAYS